MKIKAGNIISFTLLTAFAILPLLLGIGYALLYSLGLVGVLNNGLTSQHWSAAFSSYEVVLSFLYTIALSLLSITLCVAVGMSLALYLGKKLRKGTGSYFIYLPMAFPSLVAAFFFFQFLGNAGFLSRLFYKLGFVSNLADFPNMVNDKLSLGIIAAQFFLSLPIFVLLYLSIISNENIEQLKVLASSLGATRSQILTRVTLPALLKKSFPTIVLFFIFKLGSYEIPLLLGRSSPETVSVLIVRKMQRFNLLDIPQGYAIAVVYTLLILILLVISLKPSKLSVNV